MLQKGFFDFYYSLHQGNVFSPVVIAYGFNEFLGEKILEEMVHLWLKEKNEFNYQRLYLDNEEDHTWEEIIAQIQKSSLFFQSQKLVVVTIRNEKKLSMNSQDKEIIKNYLECPNEHARLYIYNSFDLMPDDFKQIKKGKLEGFLKTFHHENSLSVDLDKISQLQIKTYVKEYFRERRISISPNAIDKIVEIKGDDFISIIRELAKLEMRAMEKSNLDSEDIDEMVSGITSHSIWDLTESIEREDAATYLKILQYLFINGIKPTFIIGTLIAYYHKIYTAQFLLKHHFPVQDIGKVLQQPSFLLQKFIQTVKNFSENKIHEILNLIYRLDYESKTGGEDSARLLLQKFVFNVKSIRSK